MRRRWDLWLLALLMAWPVPVAVYLVATRWDVNPLVNQLLGEIAQHRAQRPQRISHLDHPRAGNFSDAWSQWIKTLDSQKVEQARKTANDSLKRQSRGTTPLQPRPQLDDSQQLVLRIAEEAVKLADLEGGPKEIISEDEIFPLWAINTGLMWLQQEALSQGNIPRALELCLSAQALHRDLKHSGSLLAVIIGGQLTMNSLPGCEQALIKSSRKARKSFFDQLSRINLEIVPFEWIVYGETISQDLLVFAPLIPKARLPAFPHWAQVMIEEYSPNRRGNPNIFLRLNWREHTLQRRLFTEEQLQGNVRSDADLYANAMPLVAISLMNVSGYRQKIAAAQTKMKLLKAATKVSLGAKLDETDLDQRSGLPLEIRREPEGLWVQTSSAPKLKQLSIEVPKH